MSSATQVPPEIMEEINKRYPLFTKNIGLSIQYLTLNSIQAAQRTAAIFGAQIALEKQSVTIGHLLSLIPHKTYNCQSYGLKIMPANKNQWSASYFSHFNNNTDDRIGVIIGDSFHGVLQALYDYLKEKVPELIEYRDNNQHPIYTTTN